MSQSHRPWQWGWSGITIPLLGLTVLGLVRLDTSSATTVFLQLGAIMVVWPVYLYLVNEKPKLTAVLALVVLIQGMVAVGQFLHQGDLGIGLLGERALDPQVKGISVLQADGRQWLRAYGLTGHPNLLATLLAILLLMLLPALSQAKGLSRLLLGLAYAAGLLGLLATVSRAAWLGFAVGVALWLLDRLRHSTPPREKAISNHQPSSSTLLLAALLLLVVAFLFVFRDLVSSRFLNLDTAIEARSLLERRRDMGLALTIISHDPWQGTGLGRYLIVARNLDENARVVHNVFLLVAAELGVLGALLWLWLTLAPMVHGVRGWIRGQSGCLGRLAPWVAVVVIGQFHILPWISTGWRTALLVALVAGSWVVDTQGDSGKNA
jgi:O-antigen ligase